MWIISETYSPTLLQKKAKLKRKESGEERYWSRYDQRLSFIELMKVNLSRPFIMAIKEPICIFWNVYIGIIYGSLSLPYPRSPASPHSHGHTHQASSTSASSPTRSSSKAAGTGPSASPASHSSA